METKEFLEDGLFPVRVEVYGLGYEGKDNRRLKEETEVVSVHRRALDPAAFEPPDGYRRQPLFGNRE